ncbi:hypothetical protein CmmCFBP4999_15845 [Clavibacter michiganensis subsp. michiganensis]|nr:hypothetical protein [Clavibacter michiganensis subsp. michiganensis]OQJ61500.1 hypothetical protein B5P23_15695 [Clavibacter michiganensis subsp. michiganensis]QGV76810.1 hypothetical protein EFE39_15730 [Clavibacter michiganensis subsp. michiganensis]RMC84365.1 hypothetical protein CmmCFBP4999_15845 [Clavibacter michiganensis subsp. michiganensis]
MTIVSPKEIQTKQFLVSGVATALALRRLPVLEVACAGCRQSAPVRPIDSVLSIAFTRARSSRYRRGFLFGFDRGGSSRTTPRSSRA